MISETGKHASARHRWVLLLVSICVFFSLFAMPVSASSEPGTGDGKTGNMTFAYGIIAALSVLLLFGYLLLEKKKKEVRFIALFACVSAVNYGYFLQAVSPTLECAMLGNRISYLGAAYSVLVILLIVMDVCQIRKRKQVTALLVGISTTAFLLAASGDWLGLYYRSVSIVSINGMTRLVKCYGPLHALYSVYLFSYFMAMAGVIFHAARKRKLSSPKYAIFLASVAFTNLIVWGIEQIVDVDFEFLSVSYIATEIMLLAIYGVLRDYGIVQPGGAMVSAQMLIQQNTRVADGKLPPNMEELFHGFARKTASLSSAERRILQFYIDGYGTADIPELAFISIHTVKMHNRSIYQKLDVASLDELKLYIELFRCCGRLHELTGDVITTE